MWFLVVEADVAEPRYRADAWTAPLWQHRRQIESERGTVWELTPGQVAIWHELQGHPEWDRRGYEDPRSDRITFDHAPSGWGRSVHLTSSGDLMLEEAWHGRVWYASSAEAYRFVGRKVTA
jgi:hypothetical protein